MSVWPPVIYLILAALGVGMGIKARTYTWHDVAAIFVILAILWWGNFFAPLGIPS